MHEEHEIEQNEKKKDEVLHREAFEKELMQEDASEVGEHVEDVEDRAS